MLLKEIPGLEETIQDKANVMNHSPHMLYRIRGPFKVVGSGYKRVTSLSVIFFIHFHLNGCYVWSQINMLFKYFRFRI